MNSLAVSNEWVYCTQADIAHEGLNEPAAVLLCPLRAPTVVQRVGGVTHGGGQPGQNARSGCA